MDLISCAWPGPDEPGRFLIVCSCGRWEFTGTAAEIQAASREHDDSPGQRHIVSVRGRLLEPPGGAA